MSLFDDDVVVRRWKRDDSENYMSLVAALGNLRQNRPELPEAEARKLLDHGMIGSTARALFAVAFPDS